MQYRLPSSFIPTCTRKICIFITIFTLISLSCAQPLPQGFVYLQEIIPDIVLDIRYYSEENFIGERIDGYLAPKCILTKKAAQALDKVQHDLKAFGLALKIFDAYRPQHAVNHFVRWADDMSDTTMKAQYYPDVAKIDLIRKGYIAKRSGHSRGSTVDLTIISTIAPEKVKELDMGTGFDFFGPKSRPDNPTMTPNQRANRMLLQVLMKKYGFKSLEQEWWHFTLKDEPYPDTFFDFPVE